MIPWVHDCTIKSKLLQTLDYIQIHACLTKLLSFEIGLWTKNMLLDHFKLFRLSCCTEQWLYDYISTIWIMSSLPKLLQNSTPRPRQRSLGRLTSDESATLQLAGSGSSFRNFLVLPVGDPSLSCSVQRYSSVAGPLRFPFRLTSFSSFQNTIGIRKHQEHLWSPVVMVFEPNPWWFLTTRTNRWAPWHLSWSVKEIHCNAFCQFTFPLWKTRSPRDYV